MHVKELVLFQGFRLRPEIYAQRCLTRAKQDGTTYQGFKKCCRVGVWCFGGGACSLLYICAPIPKVLILPCIKLFSSRAEAQQVFFQQVSRIYQAMLTCLTCFSLSFISFIKVDFVVSRMVSPNYLSYPSLPKPLLSIITSYLPYRSQCCLGKTSHYFHHFSIEQGCVDPLFIKALRCYRIICPNAFFNLTPQEAILPEKPSYQEVNIQMNAIYDYHFQAQDIKFIRKTFSRDGDFEYLVHRYFMKRIVVLTDQECIQVVALSLEWFKRHPTLISSDKAFTILHSALMQMPFGRPHHAIREIILEKIIEFFEGLDNWDRQEWVLNLLSSSSIWEVLDFLSYLRKKPYFFEMSHGIWVNTCSSSKARTQFSLNLIEERQIIPPNVRLITDMLRNDMLRDEECRYRCYSIIETFIQDCAHNLSIDIKKQELLVDLLNTTMWNMRVNGCFFANRNAIYNFVLFTDFFNNFPDSFLLRILDKSRDYPFHINIIIFIKGFFQFGLTSQKRAKLDLLNAKLGPRERYIRTRILTPIFSL